MEKNKCKKEFSKIIELYDAIIDDLYDGYLASNYNQGIVEIDGKEESMAEMMDKLNGLIRKFKE